MTKDIEKSLEDIKLEEMEDEAQRELDVELHWLEDYSDNDSIQYQSTELYADICDYVVLDMDHIKDDVVQDYLTEQNAVFREMAILHLASVRNGYNALQAINEVCDPKIDFSVGNSKGRTPLMCAAYAGSKENIEALIKMGADEKVRDENGNNLINYAIVNHSFDFMKWLYEKFPESFDFNDDALDLIGCACVENQEEIVKFFLAHGADINYVNSEFGSLIDHSMMDYMETFEGRDLAVYLIENGATNINFSNKSYAPQDLLVPLTNRLKELNSQEKDGVISFATVKKIQRIKDVLKRL